MLWNFHPMESSYSLGIQMASQDYGMPVRVSCSVSLKVTQTESTMESPFPRMARKWSPAVGIKQCGYGISRRVKNYIDLWAIQTRSTTWLIHRMANLSSA